MTTNGALACLPAKESPDWFLVREDILTAPALLGTAIGDE